MNTPSHMPTPNSMPQRSDAQSHEQLSALMDGELDRDATRFLLKRCESDRELVDCWQRWHVTGEIMRGGAVVPFKIDLVHAVSMALAQEDAAQLQSSAQPVRGGAGRAVLRWGGGFAVAASVALAALIVVQPAAAPDATLAGTGVLPATLDAPVSVVATVAPSSLRERDLRPPYRLDAQTVSDEGMPYHSLRFDPRIENYLRRQSQLQRAMAPQQRQPQSVRPEVAREPATVQ